MSKKSCKIPHSARSTPVQQWRNRPLNGFWSQGCGFLPSYPFVMQIGIELDLSWRVAPVTLVGRGW